METIGEVRKYWSRHAAALCAVAIFAVNAFLCRPLFSVEYTRHFQSVEGSFIALARAIAEGRGGGWWPLWNAGLPFENTYFPLLPHLSAWVSQLTGWSAARSFHAVTALFYAAGPVTLFALAQATARKLRVSVLAASLYSLLSLSCLLVPEIRNDTGGMWTGRRLYCQLYYGESPHVAALTLVPLALALLVRHRRESKPVWAAASVGVMSAILATNAFGAIGLGLGVVGLLASGLAAWPMLGLCAVSYAVVSPWVTPSLLWTIATNPAKEGGFAESGRWAGIGLALIGFLALAWLTRKAAKPVRFFTLFAFLASVIPLLFYTLRFGVLPQPWRYHMEMELGLSLLIGVWICRLRMSVFAPPLLLAGLWFAHDLRSFAGRLLQPAQLDQSIEYRLAKAVEQRFPGQRVMASGSVALWLNAFTDVPQLSGGHSQLSPNPIQLIAVFTIYSGLNAGPRDGQIAVLWMKAFGVHAVTVSEPDGKEWYKPFANPRKFAGILPEVWREGGDLIYAVPQPSRSLAHVVPEAALVARPPAHGLDVADVERYVAALETGREAQLQWRNWRSASLSADVPPGDVVSVQFHHHPRWRASIDGVEQRITKDGLGLLAIHPSRTGPCTIELTY